MVEKSVTIRNKQGLHARPAALFVQVANKFSSEITIAKGRQKINGKSIMGIMMLAAAAGSKVTIIADGDDADKAVVELEKLLIADDMDEFVI
ncbi:MAG: HPr family phosphocarrier protein [Candidatus Omnitrophota bacterium]